tara:strand:+ start:4950 stop:5186 length:237 start_codon:yes stop_codon:yes gene_type:complete
MGSYPTYIKIYPEEIKELIKNKHKIVIVGKNIYDFTDFQHPGNFDAFSNRIGTDVSSDYNFHGNKSKKHWKKYLIGYC